MNAEPHKSIWLYVTRLAAQGVKLLCEDGDLKAEADVGALTDEIRAYLRDHRSIIVEALSREKVVNDRLAAAREAVACDPSIDWTLKSETITSAELDLQDEIVCFIDGEADMEAVATAWKHLIKLRKVPGARTRTAI